MSIFHDQASLMQKARQQLQEKTLTAAETQKREEIVKSMKKSAGDFEKRYPGRGKEVMYATATKQAKKVAEESGDGYIGPARLGIKNPMASDATRAAADQRRKQQAAAAARSGQRPTLTGAGSYANQFDAMRSELKQSYEPEGEQVEEVKLSYVAPGKVEYDRDDEGNVKLSRANLKKKAGKTLRTLIGGGKDRGSIRIRFGEETQIDEGKADKKLPEHERSAARLKRYDNPSGALALGGGQQRARRAEHEERRGVKKEEVISHLIDNGFAETEQNALKIMENMSESWMEEIVEARRSEKEGKGSPESPISYPGRKIQKERGERGGRHHYSGSVEYGGAQAERGRKKSDPHSQYRRLERTKNYPEKPGKYSSMQHKKRDLGSRFD